MRYEDKAQLVKKNYEKFKKKYNLPSLKEFETEFLISLEYLSAEEETFLASLRGVLSDILSNIMRDMETILSGADRYCCYFERKAFTKNDKIRLFGIYKKLQEIFWEGRLVTFGSEKEIANWLKKVLQLWKKEFKADVIWYSEKMHRSWIDLNVSEADVKYVG